MRTPLDSLRSWRGRGAIFLTLALLWIVFLWTSPVYSSIVCIPFVRICEFFLVPLLGPGTEVHGLGGMPIERWIAECVTFGVLLAAVATYIVSRLAERFSPPNRL